jgi:hypothetical protein
MSFPVAGVVYVRNMVHRLRNWIFRGAVPVNPNPPEGAAAAAGVAVDAAEGVPAAAPAPAGAAPMYWTGMGPGPDPPAIPPLEAPTEADMYTPRAREIPLFGESDTMVLDARQERGYIMHTLLAIEGDTFTPMIRDLLTDDHPLRLPYHGDAVRAYLADVKTNRDDIHQGVIVVDLERKPVACIVLSYDDEGKTYEIVGMTAHVPEVLKYAFRKLKYDHEALKIILPGAAAWYDEDMLTEFAKYRSLWHKIFTAMGFALSASVEDNQEWKEYTWRQPSG